MNAVLPGRVSDVLNADMSEWTSIKRERERESVCVVDVNI